MKRKLLDLLVTLALALAGAATEALAQDDDGPDIEEHPFEVGAQLTFIRINFPERVVTSPPLTGASTTLPRDYVDTAGYGGRFGYNANRYLALEAEVNYLPERNLNEVFQSRRVQVFGGVRAGRRWEKVGVFAKARPGAMNFDEYGVRGPCTFAFAIDSPDCFDQPRTFFAIDLGGVVEYYPTKRTILRVDAGDTVIRFRDAGPVTFPPAGTFPGSSVFIRRETTHNFQLTFGLGFRF
jgi:hypothetical protein